VAPTAAPAQAARRRFRRSTRDEVGADLGGGMSRNPAAMCGLRRVAAAAATANGFKTAPGGKDPDGG
jgi:hypothetical protein